MIFQQETHLTNPQIQWTNIPQCTILYDTLQDMGLVDYWVGVCWTGLLTAESVYANIFDNIFGMKIYANISVVDTLVQAGSI